SQAAIYVARAPKSNASYLAIEAALKDVAEEATQEVPDHLKGSAFRGAKELGRGEGYVYPHSDPEGAKGQEYMGKKKKYYKGEPGKPR
ncbi:MAG: replication-associated recombination protein A, partial [Nitrospirota bacterium]